MTALLQSWKGPCLWGRHATQVLSAVLHRVVVGATQFAHRMAACPVRRSAWSCPTTRYGPVRQGSLHSAASFLCCTFFFCSPSHACDSPRQPAALSQQLGGQSAHSPAPPQWLIPTCSGSPPLAVAHPHLCARPGARGARVLQVSQARGLIPDWAAVALVSVTCYGDMSFCLTRRIPRNLARCAAARTRCPTACSTLGGPTACRCMTWGWHWPRWGGGAGGESRRPYFQHKRGGWWNRGMCLTRNMSALRCGATTKHSWRPPPPRCPVTRLWRAAGEGCEGSSPAGSSSSEGRAVAVEAACWTSRCCHR